MAFFLKCTHLRYPFRMHEISIGQGLEALKDVNLRSIGFVWGKIQARLFDVVDSMTWLYLAHKEKDKLCSYYADYNRSVIKVPKYIAECASKSCITDSWRITFLITENTLHNTYEYVSYNP